MKNSRPRLFFFVEIKILKSFRAMLCQGRHVIITMYSKIGAMKGKLCQKS
jgi:hypothetical protein